MPNRKIVAIHQPNFFPWLGYFNKIARADVFILLDGVQFVKTGGTWSNRVQLLVNDRASWMTMPVERDYHGTRLIREIKIQARIPWRQKMLKTIQMNYARAPFFKEIFPFITEWVNNPTDSLAEYNIFAIRAILGTLKLNAANLVIGSSLIAEGNATELLINLTREIGGTTYMCGGGAGGYQEDEKFSQAGIKLLYQMFKHPIYSQGKNVDFVPGLSILDALLHCGIEQTRALVTGMPENKS